MALTTDLKYLLSGCLRPQVVGLSLVIVSSALMAAPHPASLLPSSERVSSTAPAAPTGTNPAPAKPQQTAQLKAGWSLLTAQQQRALQPLAQSWGSLSEGQRRKWIEISRNYPSLSAADKAKMHSRMSEWVALSPRERAQARLNFAATNELYKELSPQEKQAKWETYQSLSGEEKRKLAESGGRPPAGAALPSRPVAQKKLATLPPTDTPPKAPRISSPPVAVGQQPVPAE